MAQPTDKLSVPVTLLCVVALVAGALLAVMQDINLFQYHILNTALGIPRDLISFKQNAAFVTGHLTEIADNAAFLPYPLPFLLLSVPMSWLAPKAEYVAWTISGIALLVFSVRLLKLPWAAIGLGLLTQPVLLCVTVGQTGMFVSAALMLSLGLAETYPMIAGIAAGCLIIKPQFALLLPVCFLASRNWRAIAAAAVTVPGLCALATLLFGTSIWHLYFIHGVSGSQHLVAGAWPQGYQYTMVTMFMMLRSLGVSVGLAGLAQFITSLCAAGACWHLWRSCANTSRTFRLAATLCLAFLATPYAYLYDLPALSTALAGYTAMTHWRRLVPIAILSLSASLYVFFALAWFLPGALITLTLLLLLWRRKSAVPNNGIMRC